jgi:hypothetical protein
MAHPGHDQPIFFEEGEMDALNKVIGWLKQNGHGQGNDDVGQLHHDCYACGIIKDCEKGVDDNATLRAILGEHSPDCAMLDKNAEQIRKPCDCYVHLSEQNYTLRTQLAAAQEERELIKQRAIATIKGRDADNRMLSDENARLRDRVKKLEIELSLPERTPRPYDSF